MADARSIAEVHVHAWQWAYRGHMPDDLLDGLSVVAREATWQRMLSGEAQAVGVWLADIAGVTVGFSAAGPAREADEPAHVGELYAIYLERSAIGHGIGRRLLDQAAIGLSERGFHAGMLWVLESNERARRLYEAAGWTQDGAMKCEALGACIVRELRYRIDLK